MDVWVPEQTAPELRAMLPDGISVHDLPQHGELPAALGHADMLIAGFFHERPAEAIPRLAGLRVVQSLSAGVDLLVSRIPSGVTLCDRSGIHDASVSEWVVMATLAMRRRLPEHVLQQQRAAWRFGGGSDLEGANVLIVGHGSIGRALEARLAPLGARVTRVARTKRDSVHGVDELSALLPDADVVVLLVPLTPDTRGMVDAAFLQRMRDGALLVNAARGAIVDTDALLTALREERIRAALDVTDPEPLPDGHPLWTAPGVLITPHIGGAVSRVFERGWRFAGEQVRRYLAGEPLRNVVVDGY
ncbi:MAG: 2-hydroxyacid dehydrogenase [Candidatus Dormibacteraeota bacterium]|nr:2-hydroxyacid dehydrogenase [Candidatus Dormibacteraeota bacterium]MBV9524424.1 2-hydroxyacid dehydrogenase [Candidatus Dormibacteraeota bacterium]